MPEAFQTVPINCTFLIGTVCIQFAQTQTTCIQPSCGSRQMFPTPLSRTNVQVCHAYPLVNRSLMTIINGLSGFEVVSNEDHREGRSAADILVGDEASALRWAAASTGVRVIALADAARDADVRRALTAGVSGYLLLSDGVEEIEECLHVAASGGRHICKAAAKCIADAYGRDALTKREQEVLDLITEGLCNKTIARRMAIAEGTVKTHVKSVLIKLEARTRTHAVTVALQRGLVSGIPLSPPVRHVGAFA